MAGKGKNQKFQRDGCWRNVKSAITAQVLVMSPCALLIVGQDRTGKGGKSQVQSC